MWTPELEELGSIQENINFSHEITYVDELTLNPLSVTITPNDVNSSVVVSSNIISGKYTDSFSGTVSFRTTDNNFKTVSKFSQINKAELSQIISFRPSVQEYKIYSYTAVAKNGNIVVSTKNYIKTVVNVWDTGRLTLIEYVGYTR